MEEESEVNEVARPLPECFSGRCSCPRGYSYDYTQKACLSSNTPGYNYSIQGGGHKQTGNAIKKILKSFQSLLRGCQATNFVFSTFIFFALYAVPTMHALLIADHFVHLKTFSTSHHT